MALFQGIAPAGIGVRGHEVLLGVVPFLFVFVLNLGHKKTVHLKPGPFGLQVFAFECEVALIRASRLLS